MLSLLTLPLLASLVSCRIDLKQRQQHAEKVVFPRPSLGAAGFFSVICKTGVSVIPTAHIEGNLAISPVAMTYYTGLSYQVTVDFDHATSAQVFGGLLYAGDSSNSPPESAKNAVNSMMTTYDHIMGLTGSYEPEKAGGILDGLTLTSGLYTWSTAVALHAGQTLTLLGGPDDIFVFQTSGDISFGTGAEMLLLSKDGGDGPLAANVFFATATSFTTGAKTVVYGNIFTGTNVVLGDNCHLVGGIYSQTELALAKGVRITSASPYCTSAKPADSCADYARQLN